MDVKRTMERPAMGEPESFETLVRRLCRTPELYVLGGSFQEVCAYLTGHARGDARSPLAGQGWAAFSALVSRRLGLNADTSWPCAIRTRHPDDADALEALEEHSMAFLHALEHHSPAELIERLAQLRSGGDDDGPMVPEDIFRAFVIACLHGDEQRLRALILPHQQAELLWCERYDPAVAEDLERSFARMRVLRTCRNQRSDRVELMSPSFPFPLSVVRTPAGGRLDASPVIELRAKTA
jgi:hypothetical protein